MKIAIIDMGTNTFNLLIVETQENSNYKIIFKDKAGVKLGQGGINKKFITAEAFERGLNAIHKHMKSILLFQVDKTYAIATSGVRSTENGKEFVDAIKGKFKLKVQVISGDEEAELVYRGVKQAVAFNDKHILILDIGGGSNEFIVANQQGLVWKESFDLGIARLLDMFRPSDPITQEEIQRIENYIETKLDNLYEAVVKYNPSQLVGCSGTFDSFREMIIAKNGGIAYEAKTASSYTINLHDYEKLHIDLIKSTLEERKKMEGLELVRVEMIVLASIFVNFIIRKLKIESLIQSAFAIKEGMVDKVLSK